MTDQIALDATETMVQVVSGGSHGLLLTSFGRLITWGNNDSYQLSDSV
ncbi:MAG: RCC1 domain-containing protein [Bacillus subtilis]|nr:RCC1 domain-containing protein [Bacillus subtilis]